ncbi:MAG: hypothetical protein M3O78_06410 [Chloroflexota bacterium]|nr:hypothetical protein [Chloroflexota bacterium]
MTTADRIRVAFHESAHATVAIILGIPVQAVTIRPGKGHNGATLPGTPAPAPRLERFTPAPEQAPLARYALEREMILYVLAGPIGGHLAGMPTGYIPPEAGELAAAASVERLAADTRRQLLEFEAPRSAGSRGRRPPPAAPPMPVSDSRCRPSAGQRSSQPCTIAVEPDVGARAWRVPYRAHDKVVTFGSRRCLRDRPRKAHLRWRPDP